MPKLVWRVKLVAELRPGVTTETEVACIERDEQAGLAELGLRLAEAKQLTGVVQNPAFLGYTRRAETAGLQGPDFDWKGVRCGSRRAAPGQIRWG